MPLKRSQNKSVELTGVSFVQNIVQKANCIFEPISLENDLGNDCYIEFIDNEVATSFCVFAQIKSGNSYKDISGYKIPADKDHLEYWANHLIPVIGIVYDPEQEKAFWVNITEYIKNNPSILKQQYHNIRVGINSEFSGINFRQFMQHCVAYGQEYKSYENYGRSLEEFAQVNNPDRCYEGLKSLYSNHRDKSATLFSIVQNFGRVNQKGIQFNILGLLSNLTNNPHIFWHSGNIAEYPTKDKQEQLCVLLNAYFHEKEIETAISFLREGVSRTNITFSIFLLLDMVKNVHLTIKNLAFKENVSTEERNFRIWLYIHFSQWRSKKNTLKTIDKYIRLYPGDTELYMIIGMKDAILSNSLIPIG